VILNRFSNKTFYHSHPHPIRQLFGITSKTHREKYKEAVFILADLDIIDFEKRKVKEHLNDKAKISIDGTDCPIQEQSPFDGKWWSHKTNGPGLRYEVGVCIATGFIVWINGGYPCGEFPDLKIFRLSLRGLIDDEEKVIADGGYKGEDSIWTKGHSEDAAAVESLFRARHENVNSRLKIFNCLTNRFRHPLHIHGRCFYAVANIVQLILEHESPVFEIE
jgi:hypothetical protein